MSEPRLAMQLPFIGAGTQLLSGKAAGSSQLQPFGLTDNVNRSGEEGTDGFG